MNILLISYGDYDYDGRLRELINVFERIGNLHFYSASSESKLENQGIFPGGNYIRYMIEAVKYGLKFKDTDMIVLDNRKAILPGRIIRWLTKTKIMVLDCRELYFSNDVSKISSKIGCYIEKPCIKKADIVISANQERAEIMQQRYHLAEQPLVFENIRGLESSQEIEEDILGEKFEPYIKEGEYRIVATAGCNMIRKNDVLVSNFDRVKEKCRLFLVGDSIPADEKRIRDIMKEKGLTNVEILGRLKQDELKYLINHSHVGIVNYNQDDFNNKYCASGKLFEFIFEGIPVVTTTNPPLKRMCEVNGVGEADDLYAEGINKVLANYEFYQENARDFAKVKTVESNNEQLKNSILSRLSSRYPTE
ncbi:MAG: glycosyltransferase family 4 protein [Lachnospiraceae bacterium]|nr:glycosyltransferase family 4 protein [Lachnospiraceae bacterium]